MNALKRVNSSFLEKFFMSLPSRFSRSFWPLASCKGLASYKGRSIRLHTAYKIIGHSSGDKAVPLIPHVIKVNEDRFADVAKYRADVIKGGVLTQLGGTLSKYGIRVQVKFLHARIMNV